MENVNALQASVKRVGIVLVLPSMGPLVMVVAPFIKIPARLKVTKEQFLQFAKANPDLRMERNAGGELIVMPPTGSEGGS